MDSACVRMRMPASCVLSVCSAAAGNVPRLVLGVLRMSMLYSFLCCLLTRSFTLAALVQQMRPAKGQAASIPVGTSPANVLLSFACHGDVCFSTDASIMLEQHLHKGCWSSLFHATCDGVVPLTQADFVLEQLR
eukprot:1158317-Pelagomonas_calceolata.AAC.3